MSGISRNRALFVLYIHVNQKNKIMKKQFIVIEEGNDDYYVVEDLSSLINEMYECE